MGLPLEVTIQRLTCYSLSEATASLTYRDTSIPTYKVCPKCKMEPTVHRFYTGEFLNESYHCAIHGVIKPILSAVKNDPRPIEKAEICEYCGRPTDCHFVGCNRPKRSELNVNLSAA